MINELEEEIIELKQESIELQNELQELDSYTRNLQAHCQEEIKSLEYQLFIEKGIRKQPKRNQFYWFTANRRPIGVDVSYSNKENLLYGFKQPPKYNVIEYNDLRFITHCSLDELIEQFR